MDWSEAGFGFGKVARAGKAPAFAKENLAGKLLEIGIVGVFVSQRFDHVRRRDGGFGHRIR